MTGYTCGQLCAFGLADPAKRTRRTLFLIFI